MRRHRAWLVCAVFLLARGAVLAGDRCEVCGKDIEGTVYMWEDKIAHDRKRICHKCIELSTVCYLCSMPVLRNYISLPDGRVLCKRDGRTVVLSDQEAAQTCEALRETMERHFIRFIIFPETNVTIELIDRSKIQELFKVVGNDYTCPNVWGCTEAKTNEHQVTYHISLLSGLPREVLQSTFVHECAHTWIMENVSKSRQEKMDKDALEGFCELLAFLMMTVQNNEAAKATILSNAYTRGQIDLFIAAEERFGFNEIVEWMKYGADDNLISDNLVRVRQLEPLAKADRELPSVSATSGSKAKPAVNLAGPATALLPDRITLRGISGTAARRYAIINDRTFAIMESAMIKLATTNLQVRCLEIGTNSVLIRIENTGEKRELFLPED